MDMDEFMSSLENFDSYKPISKILYEEVQITCPKCPTKRLYIWDMFKHYAIYHYEPTTIMDSNDWYQCPICTTHIKGSYYKIHLASKQHINNILLRERLLSNEFVYKEQNSEHTSDLELYLCHIDPLELELIIEFIVKHCKKFENTNYLRRIIYLKHLIQYVKASILTWIKVRIEQDQDIPNIYSNPDSPLPISDSEEETLPIPNIKQNSHIETNELQELDGTNITPNLSENN